MFTNIDRADCLLALRVFLDEVWSHDALGLPLRAKLKRRTVLWVDARARAKHGAWSAGRIFELVQRALQLACFRCGSRVRVQQNGLPLGHHLSAVLSRLTVAHFEVRGIPSLAYVCRCGLAHPVVVARWQDDTVFLQRVPHGVCVADWQRRVGSMYPASLQLEWNAGTGDTATGASVVWTDLIVGATFATVRVEPREARFAVAADFKRVVPWRSLAWLWRGGESIPMTYSKESKKNTGMTSI
eukprot:gene1208-biopygen9299